MNRTWIKWTLIAVSKRLKNKRARPLPLSCILFISHLEQMLALSYQLFNVSWRLRMLLWNFLFSRLCIKLVLHICFCAYDKYVKLLSLSCKYTLWEGLHLHTTRLWSRNVLSMFYTCASRGKYCGFVSHFCYSSDKMCWKRQSTFIRW